MARATKGRLRRIVQRTGGIITKNWGKSKGKESTYGIPLGEQVVSSKYLWHPVGRVRMWNPPVAEGHLQTEALLRQGFEGFAQKGKGSGKKEKVGVLPGRGRI